MRVCSHCGGRGKLPVMEMELTDPDKGLVEGNVQWNERGTQDCYTCEGKGVITAPQNRNIWVGDPDFDFTNIGGKIFGLQS